VSDTLHRSPGSGEPEPPWPSRDRGPVGADGPGDTHVGDDEPQPREQTTADRWMGLVLLAAIVAAVGMLAGLPALAMVLAIVVSIFLHELGHYLVARWAGMKVTEFFIGFGPKLWSFHRGETEYGVKLVLAGAYVRIIGMSNLEEIDLSDEARTYRAKPYRKRLPVILAGPFANFLIAAVLLFVVFAGFGQAQQDEWVVDAVVPGSAAEAAGLQTGDRMVSVDGTPIDDWESLTEAIVPAAGRPVDVVVERDGAERSLVATIGWRLSESGASAMAPLERGDAIRLVDGESVTTYDELVDRLAAMPPGQVRVEFERQVRTAQGSDTYPYAAQVAVPVDLPPDGSSGFFGVGPSQAPIERLGPGEALGETASGFGTIVTESVRAIFRFFSPEGLSRYADIVVSTPPGGNGEEATPAIEPLDRNAPAVTSGGADIDPNRPSSILGIIRLGSQAAEGGWVTFLGLLIIVNIFLGLFNLVPLPPLDGGHAAVATYEAIRGKVTGRAYRVNMAKLIPITYAVVFLLVGLFVTSTYLDIVDPVPNPFGP
jgi:RIP metalloprotease RseP